VFPEFIQNIILCRYRHNENVKSDIFIPCILIYQSVRLFKVLRHDAYSNFRFTL
jgi:hypothetical protein